MANFLPGQAERGIEAVEMAKSIADLKSAIGFTFNMSDSDMKKALAGIPVVSAIEEQVSSDYFKEWELVYGEVPDGEDGVFESVADYREKVMKAETLAELASAIKEWTAVVGVPHFENYSDVIDWIDERSKKHGGKKAFTSTEEYKKVFPEIQKLYEIENNLRKVSIDDRLKKAGLTYGDTVEHTNLGMFMAAQRFTGVLVKRNGFPYVKINGDAITVSRNGKLTETKSVLWNESWKKKQADTADLPSVGTDAESPEDVFSLSPEGRENEVRTAKGTKVSTKFTVIEADKLVASHTPDGKVNEAFPQELQPRDRSRDTSRLWISKVANDLDPGLLGRTKKADSGAPIVGKDRIVESGNGRALAIMEAYRRGRADEYKQWLIEDAAIYGIDPGKIERMKKPVLVRVRTSDIDRAIFAIEANQDDKLAMTATEKARSDAMRLKPELIDKYRPGADGDLLVAANRDFINGFLHTLGDAEAAQYVTTTGEPTGLLIARIQAAVFAKAYEDERLLELMADTAKPESRNIISALSAAAPEFIRARMLNDAIAQHASEKVADAVELSLENETIKTLIDAAKLIRLAKSRGESVENHLAQMTMFESIDDGVAAMAVFIAQNNKSAKRLSIAFKAMADFVKNKADQSQNLSMFEEEPVTMQDVIDAANMALQSEYGSDNEGIRGIFEHGRNFNVVSVDDQILESAIKMQAKFPGTCKKCGGKINVGDSILWEKGVGASHAQCPQKKTEKAKEDSTSTEKEKINFDDILEKQGRKWIGEPARFTRKAKDSPSVGDIVTTTEDGNAKTWMVVSVDKSYYLSSDQLEDMGYYNQKSGWRTDYKAREVSKTKEEEDLEKKENEQKESKNKILSIISEAQGGIEIPSLPPEAKKAPIVISAKEKSKSSYATFDKGSVYVSGDSIFYYDGGSHDMYTPTIKQTKDASKANKLRKTINAIFQNLGPNSKHDAGRNDLEVTIKYEKTKVAIDEVEQANSFDELVDAIKNAFDVKSDMVIESASQRETYSSGCLFVRLSETESQVFESFCHSLPENDFLPHPETGEPWIETDHHITVKYGIESPIQTVQEKFFTYNVSATLGNLDIFETPDYGVLFIEARGQDFYDMNRRAESELDCVGEKPFKPHVTLGYMKPGSGKKYRGMAFFLGAKLRFNEYVFTDKDGNEYTF